MQSADFIAMNLLPHSNHCSQQRRCLRCGGPGRLISQNLLLEEQGWYNEPAEKMNMWEKPSMDWVVDPVGFRYTLRKTYERYRLPDPDYRKWESAPPDTVSREDGKHCMDA